MLQGSMLQGCFRSPLKISIIFAVALFGSLRSQFSQTRKIHNSPRVEETTWDLFYGVNHKIMLFAMQIGWVLGFGNWMILRHGEAQTGFDETNLLIKALILILFVGVMLDSMGRNRQHRSLGINFSFLLSSHHSTPKEKRKGKIDVFVLCTFLAHFISSSNSIWLVFVFPTYEMKMGLDDTLGIFSAT